MSNKTPGWKKYETSIVYKSETKSSNISYRGVYIPTYKAKRLPNSVILLAIITTYYSEI